MTKEKAEALAKTTPKVMTIEGKDDDEDEEEEEESSSSKASDHEEETPKVVIKDTKVKPLPASPLRVSAKPLIITAEDESTPTTTPKKDLNANADDVASIRLISNTPGTTKESVYQTRDPQFVEVNREYLETLIEAKLDYDHLSKWHPEKCETAELREVWEERQAAFKAEVEKLQKDLMKRGKKRRAEWRKKNKGKLTREDEIRGLCAVDSMSEGERFGSSDPMKYTLKRMGQLRKFIPKAMDVYREERKAANVAMTIRGNVNLGYPITRCHYAGQLWVVPCPLFVFFPYDFNLAYLCLLNFTNRAMEFKVVVSKHEENFIITSFTGPLIIKPYSYENVMIELKQKRRMDGPIDDLTIYFNDHNDLERMRKEFGKDVIDLKVHYAGKVTMGLYVEDYKMENKCRIFNFAPYVFIARNRLKEYKKSIQPSKYDGAKVPPPMPSPKKKRSPSGNKKHNKKTKKKAVVESSASKDQVSSASTTKK